MASFLDRAKAAGIGFAILIGIAVLELCLFTFFSRAYGSGLWLPAFAAIALIGTALFALSFRKLRSRPILLMGLFLLLGAFELVLPFAALILACAMSGTKCAL
jgi:hypothetical protein